MTKLNRQAYEQLNALDSARVNAVILQWMKDNPDNFVGKLADASKKVNPDNTSEGFQTLLNGMRDLLAQDLAKVPPLNATQIENKTVGFDPSRLPDHYQTAQGIIYTPDQILGGQRKALLDVKGLMPRQISLAPGVVAERTADLPGPARAYDQPANIVLSTALANEPYQTGTNFFFWPSYNAPREQALER